MISAKTLILKRLLFVAILINTIVQADTDRICIKTQELPRSETFPPQGGKLAPLQGKIKNGRYYAPKNIFSCQADDFGEGKYIAQDALLDGAACVSFYSAVANFKKAEVIFMPGLEKVNLDKKALRDVFESFGIGILKDVDNAQGIEILREEMVGDNMLFVTISIEKMSVLTAPDGKYMPSTRGYLAFQDKDKLVLLSNQEVTLPAETHTPKKHIEKLKKGILEFRKTFEFGPLTHVGK